MPRSDFLYVLLFNSVGFHSWIFIVMLPDWFMAQYDATVG